MGFDRGVIGLGRSGTAVLERSLSEGMRPERLLAWVDRKPGADEMEAVAGRGVDLCWGEAGFERLADCTELVVSPGVNARAARFEILRQANVPLMSELEWSWRRLSGQRVVAVTGANGKSTTVSLLHHLLSRSGRDAVLAGNIGLPLAAVLGDLRAETIVVLEVSSFQLEESWTFRPHIGVLTNITPDHLDRHGDMDVYGRLKMSLFAQQEEGDFALLNGLDPWTARLPRPGRGRPVWLGPVAGSALSWEGGYFEMRPPLAPGRIATDRNPLLGPHNLENSAAALAAGRLLGLGVEEMASHWSTFRGLAHRMEAVASCQGVSFVNDSKATNVDAALRALQGQSHPVVLILGGRDKGGGFGRLREEILRCCVRVLLIGESARQIRSQLGPGVPVEEVGDLERAVPRAGELLRGGGGVTLLAPACASFDQYRNFEERGDHFGRLARSWCVEEKGR